MLAWGGNKVFAASVTQIVNGNFEADAATLPEDNDFHLFAFGWDSSGSAGVLNPSEGPAPQSFDIGQVGETIAGWANPSQFLSQDLTGDYSTLTSGFTYTVSARVGSRRDNSGSNYNISFGDINGTILANRTHNDVSLVNGEFVNVSFSYTAPVNGDQIRIQLMNTGGTGQIVFDDIALTVVPEPKSYAIFCGLFLVLFAVGRSRMKATPIGS